MNRYTMITNPGRLLLALITCLLAAPWAQAQLALPVYEPFNYANNERIGTTSLSITNWNSGNSTGTGSVTTTNGVSLSYPGLPAPTGIAAWFTPTTPSSGRNRGLQFASQVLSDLNPTVYYSFLLNVQANPSGLKQIFALSSSGTSLASAMTLFLTTDGKLALGKNSSTAASATMANALSAGTHLVVVRYKFVTGTSNDELALWVDPGSLGAAEGSVPAATLSTTSGTDASSSTLASLYIVHQTTPAPPGSFYVDELRIAKTWAEVAPLDCTPGTAFNVTPAGNNSFCPGDPGIAIGLAGSETGIDYQLKLNGVAVGSALPGTGSALDFGFQTAAGAYTVAASNTTTACVGLMTGTATVAANTPPGISVQPSPAQATNSVGGSRTFLVTATGSGLSYQWRHAGTNLLNGGSISGATTATLNINPVGTGDAGTYECVVSGSCSPAAISDSVVLTVRLPSNLTWVGDGSANLWDLTTPNWTGEATTFADGDNVTFNNSGNNAVAIDLVGTISPVVINVNATQDYTIGSTTTGSLSGTSAINKSGGGKLTLTTVNTQVGKTTITGGTVSIDAGNKLGAAPASFVADQLTLNGGALQVTASGSINANRGTTLGAAGGTFNVDPGVNFTNTPVTTGPGSLTKIGAGILRLPTANTYVGNTIISNGTVSVGNASALGSGTAVLAGGTLDFPAATTIANSVQVSQDSTLSFGTSGNSAVVLNGLGLAGTSGRTLTITPTVSVTASTRVRVNNGLTNSLTFDANLVLNGTFTYATYNNEGDQVYNGVISGAGILGRRSPLAGVAGRTILNGDNTYSGGTVIADGAIGFGIDSTGSPTVTSGPIGTGALSFENNAGTLHRLFASGGARTVGNAINWPATANQDLTIEGSNALTLTGDMDLGAATRTIACNNSAATTLGGVISNGGLTKTGPGVLLLNGVNTYSGTTTVSNGTLGGLGTISGPVVVEDPGTLAPGTTGIGTLTVNGDVTLNGNTAVDINASTTGSDLVTGIATANYGGTLTVNNLAGTVALGQSYTLFSATTHNGTFSSFSPANPNNDSALAWSFANGVLSVVNATVAQPTLNVSQSGNTLTFNWTGAFKLQSQTNNVSTGLSNNWSDYPGGETSPIIINIDPANGSVFFRLIDVPILSL